MKHVIIGFGTIGHAFATWLRSKNEAVLINDIDMSCAKKMGFSTVEKEEITASKPDYIWVCTAEWHVDNVLKDLKGTKTPIIIRSTIKPGELAHLKRKFNIDRVAHIPEFLRQDFAIEDVFNEDRVIIGSDDEELSTHIKSLFEGVTTLTVTPDESALIKLTANSWLATQISFWNDIKRVVDKNKNIRSEVLARGVTLDKRISTYGSNLTGKPYGGFCLPKDLESLRLVFLEHQLVSIILPAVNEVNEGISDD
jgi:UDP-glucose 6-dehydrogenase